MFSSYAYFEFDHTDDGEKMVNELQGTYYLGNYINARIEEGKTYSQEKDQGMCALLFLSFWTDRSGQTV